MFNEENTVEQIILDTLCDETPSNVLAEEPSVPYGGKVPTWKYIPADDLPREY